MTEISENNKMPENLSDAGKTAYEIIMGVMGDVETGGCITFYSPEQWKERKEEYGTRSELIICYDGGDVGKYFSYDEYNYTLIDKMSDALEKAGLYSEQCTCWYSAVYNI